MQVTFLLVPTPLYNENYYRSGIEWEVRLRVKTRDLARLMREGFQWTTENVCPDMTYIEPDLQEEALTRVGWSCSRNYYLSDLGNNPYWAAKLIVCARNLDVLSRFKVSDLRQHMISQAFARNGEDGPFSYRYRPYNPHLNFNAIYGDFPLEGWWPWPKRQSTDITGTYPDL